MEKGVIEKAKLFENNLSIENEKLREIQNNIHTNACRYIYDILNEIDGQSIDLKNTNESTIINCELCYFNKVYIDKNENKVIVVTDAETDGLTIEDYVNDLNASAVSDLYYTIVQELKRKYEWS